VKQRAKSIHLVLDEVQVLAMIHASEGWCL
jgi:hypothetical protein